MDTLRASGQIYHAKNLHSARSTSKAKGTEFQGASGHWETEVEGVGEPKMHIRLPEWQKLAEWVQNERFSWSGTEWLLSQHSSASSIFKNRGKSSCGRGEKCPPTPLRCSEQKQQQKEKREGEDGEIGGCLANLLSYTFLDVLALR